MNRDRDRAGRPRSARPRDAAGRPLARDAAGEPGPPAARRPPREALATAQALIDADRPFAAHEVLEEAWKAAPGPERDFWRALTQLAVGLTHLQRGNRTGAVALLRRGADLLSGCEPSYGVDVPALCVAAQALAEQVAAGHPGARRLRLT